jgi:radical SAM protein with 4Fe4S-binding SPASM domain
MKLVRSPYLHIVLDEEGETGFAYHSLFGNPLLILNREGLALLSLFDQPITVNEASAFCEGDPAKVIDNFRRIFFLVDHDLDERALLRQKQLEHLERVRCKQTVDHISLSVSNSCNLGCAHCMFFQYSSRSQPFQGVFTVTPRKMRWEVAKQCVDAYVRVLQETCRTHSRIHFGDAEPLLNWEVVERILGYCESLSGISFEYAINTNLVLLNERIAYTFKQYGVKVATSLDGLGAANDTIRVTRSGRGTFSKIMENVALLDRIGYPLDGISVTVTDRNFPMVDIEIVDFTHSRGMKSIAFDYDLVNPLRVSVGARVDKIMRLRAYANRLGIYFDGTWGAPFRRLTAGSILERPFGFCSAVEGAGLSFDTDGSVKVCDYSLNKIGHVENLDTLFEERGGLYKLIEARFPGQDSLCKGCPLEVVCGGQCHITREVAARTSDAILADMCEFYRAMTLALIRDTLYHHIQEGGTKDEEGG